MGSSILQVRDVPDEVLAELRARAANAGVSLSAYIRTVLTREVSTPPMEETIDVIASRTPVHLTNEDIVSAIDEGRR